MYIREVRNPFSNTARLAKQRSFLRNSSVQLAFAFILQLYHRILLVPKDGDLERHLRPLVFLPNHHWGNYPHPSGLYFLTIVWEGEVKLLDECDQKRVYLHDTIGNKQPVSQFFRFRFGFNRKGKRLTRTSIQYNSYSLHRT